MGTLIPFVFDNACALEQFTHLKCYATRVKMNERISYINGAGVSAKSGIPTFRGTDGLWTVGSQNYTPQEMATRQMYLSHPDEFLLWYFKRFASYRHIKPNAVHHWLADKRLVTQNIDGLDGKAGNAAYVPIHGRLDRATLQSSEQRGHQIHGFSSCNCRLACMCLN